MPRLRVKDPHIGSLRKKMSKELGVRGIFGSLTRKQELMLQKASEFSEYRRVENERQLEEIKNLLWDYMFNKDVVVRGIELDKDEGVRVIELSKFEAMLKATTMYLAAMNLQNKMWGIYTTPTLPANKDVPGTITITKSAVQLVQELQNIVKRERPKQIENGSCS